VDETPRVTDVMCGLQASLTSIKRLKR